MSTRRAKAHSTGTSVHVSTKRPTIRRVHSAGAGAVSGSATGSGTSSSSSATVSSSSSVSSASSNADKSKLRANRERRRRERNLEDDELEQKFSNLSVSAPVFTPAAMRSSTLTSPTASWLAKAKPAQQRRVPPVYQKQQQQQQEEQATPVKPPTPMSQWSVPSPKEPKETKDRSASVERRPRRQRIGTLGFSRSGAASPSMNRRTPTTPTSGSFQPSLQLGTSTRDTASTESTGNLRKRSDSTGSDDEYGSDDEVYPEKAASTSGPSAFPERLTLFTQQKKVPKNVVSRGAVIDTVFAALFTKKEKSRADHRRFSAFGDDDDTGTETDEPNEDFVKRGLAASLFKDSLDGTINLDFARRGHLSDEEAIDRFITPAFIHTLVTDMRFEDFRTASARIDILRAIHKSCPTKRIHIARALADATSLRYQYVVALTTKAHALEIEKNKVVVNHKNDHSHGFTELLRYAIEHVGESLNSITGASTNAAISQRQGDELVRNYLLALVYLWRTHWWDTAGSDDEELITCAGQFVAYVPQVTPELLDRLLRYWPTRFPPQEVIAIRMIARVIMTSPPLHTLNDPRSARLPIRVFARLAQSVRSSNTQVAQEALAFTGCQFALVHFLGHYEEIYKVISEAFHTNATSHWNAGIRTTSEGHFDRALDYAPIEALSTEI
ncbi:hypothetical protein Poli38472_007075 [Pythium oligandrum]|uniref:Uncharacterized protein n=1 Tax=Pythium oligandrum TaxID=41045 RepID=A0A8K1C9F2_PYTOL|nr:hypothetical protein Poli38472_007075 [Pythium oligandrum]|eukprot:TMW58930.1 hypothetical protein Poli38472_007075 [Pythium oligandrum]